MVLLELSLLFNGFSVFDDFLTSVIPSSVFSPTGGMVMSFSSAVFDTHLTNVFNMLFSCIQVFSKTRHLSLGNSWHCGCWRICCSRFLEDRTSLPSDGFFCFKIILQSFIKQHNVWFPCRFGIYSYISSTISGLDHCTYLSYLALGFVQLINRTRSLQDKSQSQCLTSKKLAHCYTQNTINSKHPSQNSQ